MKADCLSHLREKRYLQAFEAFTLAKALDPDDDGFEQDVKDQAKQRLTGSGKAVCPIGDKLADQGKSLEAVGVYSLAGLVDHTDPKAAKLLKLSLKKVSTKVQSELKQSTLDGGKWNTAWMIKE